MDITDMVDYNVDLLNRNTSDSSFFHLDPTDPLVGFPFDATHISGHTFPPTDTRTVSPSMYTDPTIEQLSLRLLLGSHLARQYNSEHPLSRERTADSVLSSEYLRHQLEEHKDYVRASTVGLPCSPCFSSYRQYISTLSLFCLKEHVTQFVKQEIGILTLDGRLVPSGSAPTSCFRSWWVI